MLRYDVLKDIESGCNPPSGVDSLYPDSAPLRVSSVLPSVLPSAALGYERSPESRSGLGLVSSSAYGYGSLSMGDNGYGYLSSHSSSLYPELPPPSSFEMVIPTYAVSKVMGKGGTNFENIHKISGAAIEISDFKSSHGDFVALISGTTEQKRSAENLSQAFILAT